MADSNGNYQANVQSATTSPTVQNAPGVHGDGAPGVGVPTWARFYIDDENGNFYIRADSGWVLVGP